MMYVYHRSQKILKIKFEFYLYDLNELLINDHLNRINITQI